MNKDRDILRILVEKYAVEAALPQQGINRNNWNSLNGLKPVKPLVMIDQLPWHELNINEELTLKCEDPFLRSVEDSLRKTLFKWNHIPADMVLDPFIRIPKAMTSTGYGVEMTEHTLSSDKNNTSTVSHEYEDKITSEEQLSLFKTPVIKQDREESRRRRELCGDIFGDILPPYMTGHIAYSHIWDVITNFRGVTPVYMDLMDKPDLIGKTIARFAEMHMKTLDQYEVEGLLEANDLIHCTGAYTEELSSTTRGPGEDQIPLKTGDCWTYSAAQLFSSVSPDMHYEFDIEPMMKVFKRFGLVYYGCCEPLDKKIDKIKNIPNVRKISISPWADVVNAAEQLGGDYVLSRKPNPAVLAELVLDEDRIKKEIGDTLKTCKENGTPSEIILKDVSTIRYKPENLFRWESLVREIVEKS